jgi:hypothetical protein
VSEAAIGEADLMPCTTIRTQADRLEAASAGK